MNLTDGMNTAQKVAIRLSQGGALCADGLNRGEEEGERRGVMRAGRNVAICGGSD